MDASLLFKSACLLGEGPLWQAGRNTLYWVDIENRRIHSYHVETGAHSELTLPFRPSALFQGQDEDTLFVAVQGSLQKLDLKSEKLTWIKDIEKNIQNNRCNDGRCDKEGRLWIGTMDVDCLEGRGSLYCVHPDLSIEKKLTGLTIPNGMTWTLNGKTMYHTDTGKSQVSAYSYDHQSGSIAFEQVVIEVPLSLGKPDGMAMDERGMLWIAHWDGHGVYCWDPVRGEVIETIKLPVPKVTACAFGGKNRDELFITTASTELSPEDLERYPLSGSVFHARPGVKGAEVFRFRPL